MNASELLPAQFNAATWFVDRNIAEGRGTAPAFTYEGRTLTYADVHELVNRTGNALVEIGVEPEHRVLMLCLDAPEFLGTFWGAIKIGAVPIPTNTLMRTADYLYFLDDSRARVAVVSAPLLAEAGPALAEAKYLKHVLVAGGVPGQFLSYEERVAKASSVLTAAVTSRDDPAYWQYSSGSTGFPKGAMSVGAQAILYPRRPTPEGVFEAITRYRPTLFFGIPTLFAAMLAVKDAEKRFDASSLRLCVSAGEALPEELYKRWRERFGVEIVDGIGTTEIGYIFISNRPGHARPGSTGVAVPGYELAIVDDDGRPVPRGEIGNIRVKGDSTMAYYWNKHEKTKETLFGQWIQTGDKYYQDQDGFYWYCGRSDDMLKVGGIWVSPVEVEGTLIRHDAVLEAAVVGREDTDRLVKPHAYVVLKDPAAAGAPLADELKLFVKDKIAPYKYPRWIDFVTELPKTATGKIQRFKLRT